MWQRLNSFGLSFNKKNPRYLFAGEKYEEKIPNYWIIFPPHPPLLRDWVCLNIYILFPTLWSTRRIIRTRYYSVYKQIEQIGKQVSQFLLKIILKGANLNQFCKKNGQKKSLFWNDQKMYFQNSCRKFTLPVIALVKVYCHKQKFRSKKNWVLATNSIFKSPYLCNLMV